MLSNLIFVSLFVLSATAGAAVVSTGPCQTQEAVQACPVQVSGLDQIRVTYTGYLLGKGRPVAANFMNNGAFYQYLLDQQGQWPHQTGVTYIPVMHGDVALYFWSTTGEYDSRYGQNYHFSF